MTPFTDDVVQTILLAAKLLTGHRRRQFQVEMPLKYCKGSARQAEKLLAGDGPRSTPGSTNSARAFSAWTFMNFAAAKRPKNSARNSKSTSIVWSTPKPRPIPSFRLLSRTLGSPPRSCVRPCLPNPNWRTWCPVVRPWEFSSTVWPTGSAGC